MNEAQDISRRTYRMIKDNFIVIRGLQMAGGIESSVVFQIFRSVFKETGDKYTNIFLVHLILSLQEQEKRIKRRKQ